MPRADHVAQGGEGLVGLQRVGALRQTRVGDGGRRLDRIGVVLDHHHDHLVGMGLDEGLDLCQRFAEAGGAQLAPRMAEVDAPVGRGCPGRPGCQLVGPLGRSRVGPLGVRVVERYDQAIAQDQRFERLVDQDVRQAAMACFQRTHELVRLGIDGDLHGHRRAAPVAGCRSAPRPF